MNTIPTASVLNLISAHANATDSTQQASAQQASAQTSRQSIASAAQGFEAVFISMMIKQLRETLQDGLFTKETSDSFGALFDLYMGEHLAQSSPLGVGDAAAKYLEAQKSQ